MDTVKTCQHCGKPIPPKVTHGLCPDCLLKVGLGSGTASQAGDAPPAGPRRRVFTPPEPRELAPHFAALEIITLLGQGGMGAVYQARQKNLDRMVALKILPAEGSADPAFAERFTREARTLARLNHPHIVAVHDFGQAAGFYFFVMEYVDGVTLRQSLSEKKLAPQEALAVVPQICDALQYAHSQGVVHRDIKPENILLDKSGRVKIADFGLAKLMGTDPQATRLTRPREVMGTPHYMAPEQIEHPQEVDHRADIYSLGVVFYEMLTGELPLGKFPPPSSRMGGVQVDVRLDQVVLRTLEKEPERRYQHASEVKTDVETITLAGADTAVSTPADPATAPTPTTAKNTATLSTREQPAPPRHRGLKPMLATLGIVVVVAGLLFVLGRQREKQMDSRLQPPAISTSAPGQSALLAPAQPEESRNRPGRLNSVAAESQPPAEYAFLYPPLERGSTTVFGTVIRPDGSPASGAKVLLLRGEKWERGVALTTAAGDGSYALEDLPDGFYFLVVAETNSLSKRWIIIGENLSKQNRLHRDLRLGPLAGKPIGGRVRDSQGQPVGGALIVCAASPEHYGLSLVLPTTSDRDGRFVLRSADSAAPPPPLIAFAKGHGPGVLGQIAASATANEIELDSGARVSGVVRIKHTGQPGAGLAVKLRLRSGPELPPLTTRTDVKGAFLFDQVGPFRYTLEIDEADKGLVLSEKREVDLSPPRAVEGVELIVSPGASVSGTVKARESGEPLAGVRVRIPDVRRAKPIRETRTGPDGKYTLRGLPAGGVSVTCDVPCVREHTDPAMDSDPLSPTSKQVSLRPDEQLTGVDFTFERGLTVSGRVTDQGGHPVPGARVSARNFQWVDHSIRRLSTLETLTDGGGNYRLGGFVPSDRWNWWITVSAESHGRLLSEPLKLAGDLSGKQLVLEKAAMISGRAVDTDGEPLGYTIIGLKPVDGQARRPLPEPVWTDDEGLFAFREGAYPYMYYFESNSRQRATNDPVRVEGTNSLQVEVVFPSEKKPAATGSKTRPDPALGTNAYVSGRVVDTVGRPQPGLAIDFIPTIAKVLEDGQGRPAGMLRVPVDPQGRFWIPQAIPGRYWVKVCRAVDSADPAWTQLAQNDRLLLRPGERTEDLEIRILPLEDRVISGTVLDGQGQPRSGVGVDTFIPHDCHWYTQTDKQGRFVLKSLNGIGRDPLDLTIGAYTLRRVPIGTNLTFVIPEPGRISGRVMDGGGQNALTNSTVKVQRVERVDGAGIAFEPKTELRRAGQGGAFEIANVPPGRVILQVETGERRQWPEVWLQPGQATNTTLDLQPPCVFEGVARCIGQTESLSLDVVHLATGQWMPAIQTDISGTFRCSTLPEGEYQVRANFQNKLFLTKLVRLAHGQTVREHFEVGGRCTLRGTVRFPAEDYEFVQIQVRETGLNSPPEVWNLRPGPLERVVAHTVATQSGAEYELPNLPAGAWEVAAFGFAPDRCVPYERRPHQTQAVAIAGGETRRLDLDLTVPSRR